MQSQLVWTRSPPAEQPYEGVFALNTAVSRHTISGKDRAHAGWFGYQTTFNPFKRSEQVANRSNFLVVGQSVVQGTNSALECSVTYKGSIGYGWYITFVDAGADTVRLYVGGYWTGSSTLNTTLADPVRSDRPFNWAMHMNLPAQEVTLYINGRVALATTALGADLDPVEDPSGGQLKLTTNESPTSGHAYHRMVALLPKSYIPRARSLSFNPWQIYDPMVEGDAGFSTAAPPPPPPPRPPTIEVISSGLRW